MNAAGYYFSHIYGFGVMDAGRMCELAKNWKTVDKLVLIREKLQDNTESFTGQGITKNYKIKDIISDVSMLEFRLETVTAILSISFPYRGQLEIYLTAPSKTTTQLLFRREQDRSPRGFNQWEFMSVMFWDENPAGDWILEIRNVGKSSYTGALKYVALQFSGTDGENTHGMATNVKIQQTDDAKPAPTQIISAPRPDNCQTAISEYECDICSDNFYLFQGSCVSSCPLHYGHQNSPKKFCEKCHDDCLTCSGNLSSQCLSCSDGYVLNSANMCARKVVQIPDRTDSSPSSQTEVQPSTDDQNGNDDYQDLGNQDGQLSDSKSMAEQRKEKQDLQKKLDWVLKNYKF